MYFIKKITYWMIAWPAIIVFFLQHHDNKKKILMDIARFEQVRSLSSKGPQFWRLYKMMVAAAEFRSLYYMRVGHFSKILKYFLPGMKLCSVASTKTENVGGGVYIQHGWGMVLDAESVGENLWINQNVTVGYKGNGHPRIGNNVRIGTGAVVLGGITIGDNVNIGANAIVVKDVPSNTTVVSPSAYICKMDGVRVLKKL